MLISYSNKLIPTNKILLINRFLQIDIAFYEYVIKIYDIISIGVQIEYSKD